MELGRKARVLCVLKLLETNSDENHSLTASELLDLLKNEGINAERKAIYDDIEILRELGYQIGLSGGNNRGYYLESRQFSMPEVGLLIDAVLSAGFIPKGQTKNFVTKLQGLVSVHQAKELASRVCIENRAKSENDEVYSIIERLNEAITDRKAVKIEYAKSVLTEKGVEKSAKEITVNPYALLWENDRYYLIGNNPKYDNLMHLRVDRIERVASARMPWRHFSEVSEYSQRFDTADYARKAFNMFGGEKCRIDLECRLELYDKIIDRFGRGMFIRFDKPNGVFRFGADALISEGLIGWLMQFGGAVKVLSPESLKQDLAQKAKEITDMYK